MMEGRTKVRPVLKGQKDFEKVVKDIKGFFCDLISNRYCKEA